MEFGEVIRRRRMVRDYDPDRPVPPEVVRRLLEHAIRAPSAGFSQGWGFLVLTESADRDRFWQATTPPGTPAGSGWLAGMRRAPLIIVAHSCRQAYLDRYAEPDKARTGLGEGADAWPVPYWVVDTAFATMTFLHAVVDAGLGALFFGIFRDEDRLLRELAPKEKLQAAADKIHESADAREDVNRHTVGLATAYSQYVEGVDMRAAYRERGGKGGRG